MVAVGERAGNHFRASEGCVPSENLKHHVRDAFRYQVGLFGVVSEVFDAVDYPVAQLRVPLVIVAQSLLELGYPELSFVIYKLADYVQALDYICHAEHIRLDEVVLRAARIARHPSLCAVADKRGDTRGISTVSGALKLPDILCEDRPVAVSREIPPVALKKLLEADICRTFHEGLGEDLQHIYVRARD